MPGGAGMLEVRGLTKHFDGLTALSDLDFSIRPGEIVGVIGPNGAGKTTLFNVLTGFLKPSGGQIRFQGQDIVGLKPSRIAGLGLVRTWQLVNLIGSQSVYDNLLTACHLQYRIGLAGSILGGRSSREEARRVAGKAEELLVGMGLDRVKEETASSLSHGLQRLLGVCLALAARPRLLLLDEPAAGMSAAETASLMERIEAIRREGLTVMLVEHDMKVIMNTCDRIIVLNFGRKLAEGAPTEIAQNREVVTAYLGFENGGFDEAP